MSIHSPQFWLFLLSVVCLYWIVPSRFRWLVLLGASYYFYASFDRQYVLLLLIPTAVTYLSGLGLARTERPGLRRLYVIGTVFALLGLLAVFKYLQFLETVFSALRNALTGGHFEFDWPLLLPIGISFFVFKLLSYILDVYHQRIPAEKHAGLFAAYVSFFPQLLAGPIERAKTFLPQLRSPSHFDVEKINQAIVLIAWGFFKKTVIADRLGLYVNEVWKNPDGQGLHVLFSVYFYAIQIYCDFSGYTDIANGITRMLGFQGMENFDAPYSSRSITEFWTRWHISLSFWFRDYLFLPTAYAIMRRIPSERLFLVKAEFWGYALAMLLTMGLCGLWHGAAWTFVVWGLMHGAFLIASYSTKSWRKKVVRYSGLREYPRLHHVMGVVFTFHLVCLSWIVFRAPSLGAAWNFLARLNFRKPIHGLSVVIFNLAIILLFFAAEYISRHRNQFGLLDRVPRPLKIAGFALFLCLIAIFAVDTRNEFIYFRF